MAVTPDGNRLAQETSPYLLQHKDNPVHWRAWTADTLAEARAADKPILLSVGYAACHWCHVMAHESFENAAIAARMNDLFVNIKVDREERPDIDTIYQSALAMLGEQGGWPLTMFLTPDGEPFWGGTYFPPTARWGRPGFPEVLDAVARTYRDDPTRVGHNVGALRDGLQRLARPAPGDGIDATTADGIALRILQEVDAEHGGIGGAPKFPQAAILRQLWSAHGRGARPDGDGMTCRDAVLHTLNRICEGGIYDHLGGGFARYAVDARWLVPHFEKMLYDNAQLLELLALAWLATGDPLFRQRAEETVDWILDDMVTPEGAFAAARDADSEGEEGKFYVWAEAEIDGLLAPDEAALFKAVYDVTPHGNWEGKTILNRLDWRGTLSGEAEKSLGACREILLNARLERIAPLKDDKVLADWNGMMIAALATAAPLFERSDWLDAAKRAFDFIAGPMSETGRPRHAYRAGVAKIPATLDDLAALIRAALALEETIGDGRYLSQACHWADLVLERYRDPDGGGFFLTADDAEGLITRTKSASDNATPSGNGQLVAVFTKLHWLTGEAAYDRAAEDLVTAFAGELSRNFFPYSNLIEGARFREEGLQIAVIGPSDRPDTAALMKTARHAPIAERLLRHLAPGTAVPAGSPLAGKTMIADKAAAYVCRGPVCSLPITNPETLAATLSGAD